MVPLEKILERKKDVSGQISAQTRTLALGMLAISWALLTVHDDPLRTMAAHVGRPLLLAFAVCSVLVIVFDLFQYVAGNQVVDSAIKAAETSPKGEAQYNAGSLAYKAQALLFWGKVVFLAGAAVMLTVIFVRLFSGAELPATPPTQTPAVCQCQCAPPPLPAAEPRKPCAHAKAKAPSNGS